MLLQGMRLSTSVPDGRIGRHVSSYGPVVISKRLIRCDSSVCQSRSDITIYLATTLPRCTNRDSSFDVVFSAGDECGAQIRRLFLRFASRRCNNLQSHHGFQKITFHKANQNEKVCGGNYRQCRMMRNGRQLRLIYHVRTKCSSLGLKLQNHGVMRATVLTRREFCRSAGK